MLIPENRILVSKMAEIHKISRQTLILYDKIGLFHPALVDENGYRYYTYTQVPYLREICFLKSVGVKLEEIKEHIETRSPQSAIELLKKQDEELSRKIKELQKMRQSVLGRVTQFEDARKHEADVYRPYIDTFPRRAVIFSPWETTNLTRKVLHLRLMKAWTTGEEYASIPPSSWGALISKDALNTDEPLAGAGAYVDFECDEVDIRNVPGGLVLEAGEYACMYKCGMPYEIEHIRHLQQWIADNGYEITGDVVDACLMDTTFYDTDMVADFCHIQIPVRKCKD